jgi:hypothetical protein
MQMTIVITKAFTIANLKEMTEQEQREFAEEFGQNVVLDTDELHLGSAYITECEELENTHSVAIENN